MDRFIYSTKKQNDKLQIEWIPILSLLLAIISVLANIVVTNLNNNSTKEIKEFELTFQEKRKLFTEHSRYLSAVINNLSKLDTLLSTISHDKEIDSAKSNILGERIIEPVSNKQQLRLLEDEINKNILELISNGTEMSPFLKSFKSHLKFHLFALNDSYTLYLTLVGSENRVATIKKNSELKPTYKHLKDYKDNLDKVTNDYAAFVTDTLFYKLFPEN